MKVMAVIWLFVFIAVVFVGYMSGVEITVPSLDAGRVWFLALALPTICAPFFRLFLVVFKDLS